MNDKSKARVTVTHPRTLAPQREGTVRPALDLDESSPVNDLALRSLMQAQLRLSLLHALALAGLLLGAVVIAGSLDSLANRRLIGVPLVWIMLGGGLFVPLFLIARSYVTRVEALERRTQALLRGM
jgi:hypothetical protein